MKKMTVRELVDDLVSCCPLDAELQIVYFNEDSYWERTYCDVHDIINYWDYSKEELQKYKEDDKLPPNLTRIEIVGRNRITDFD